MSGETSCRGNVLTPTFRLSIAEPPQKINWRAFQLDRYIFYRPQAIGLAGSSDIAEEPRDTPRQLKSCQYATQLYDESRFKRLEVDE